MRDSIIYQVFRNTSDAVFGIDETRKVRFWNEACEKLTGLSGNQVKGTKCYEVIKGSDLDGTLYCVADCHVSKELVRGKPVTNYDLVINGPEGNSIMVNIGTYVIPRRWRKKIDCVAFFALRRVDCYGFIRRLRNQAGFQISTCKPSKYHLTSREIEILELASQGVNTSGIAEGLTISPVTVRNHFRNILSKLGVHSRSEAISLALRSHFF